MFRLKLLNYLFVKTIDNPALLENNTKLKYFVKCQCMSSEKLFKNVTKPPLTTILEDSNENEKEFLIKLKNDPNTFGCETNQDVIVDEGDLMEEQFLEEKPSSVQKLKTKQYADIIKPLLAKRKIKEAIDVVETRMIKEDRVKPENYIYNLLLGGCGRVGYTKKAFSLYNNMKKRGLKVTGGTYTALFNACANSPFPNDGVTRASHLRNIMIEKMFEPNGTVYNSMIKAFGRGGDLNTAFSLVDEMIAKKLVIKHDTINFLLQACISDKESGFRHALLVWRKLIDKKIKPSVFTFNLMLRSIRDCGIGDLEVMEDVLNTILPNKVPRLGSIDTKLITAVYDNKLLIDHSSNNLLNEKQEPIANVDNFTENNSLIITDSRPNLMAKVPHLGNIISLSEIKKAEDRLLLVGGFKEFLNNMKEYGCNPDIKTFTQLLDSLPGSIAAENEFLAIMKKLNVKPDVDFLNMLIKKRSMRFEYEKAKEVLFQMDKFNYLPNIITYGVLALGCTNKSEGQELLNAMREKRYTINIEILGAMLHQACYHNNFPYVLELMETCLKEQIKPSKKFMEMLTAFKDKSKEILNDKNNKLSQSIPFQKGFRIFRMRFNSWQNEIEVDDKEDEHPWTQYRQTSNTDVSKYKDKDVRFKQRHISLYRVKTSTKKRY